MNFTVNLWYIEKIKASGATGTGGLIFNSEFIQILLVNAADDLEARNEMAPPDSVLSTGSRRQLQPLRIHLMV